MKTYYITTKYLKTISVPTKKAEVEIRTEQKENWLGRNTPKKLSKMTLWKQKFYSKNDSLLFLNFFML